MSKSPKIGLTMRLELETDRFYLGRDYCEAVQNFGALPMHIGLIPKRDYIKETLRHLDGVLLPGSDTDVDPLRFDQQPHPKLKKVIFVKEETDLLVLEEAENLGLPVLGICFGMQVLNVFRGGTLFQDIEAEIPGSLKHEQGVPRDRNSHEIKIKEDSMLARLITNTKAQVNSRHHQAINTVGNNLQASAWAQDGVIECVEDTRPDRFVLGVQWHPELNWKSDNLSNEIFRTFVDEASKNAEQRS
jgi:putative glutamine amidotransferase